MSESFAEMLQGRHHNSLGRTEESMINGCGVEFPDEEDCRPAQDLHVLAKPLVLLERGRPEVDLATAQDRFDTIAAWGRRRG